MKISIDKSEGRGIIKKHLETMFPNTQVKDGSTEYGDFEFEVIKKEQTEDEKK